MGKAVEVFLVPIDEVGEAWDKLAPLYAMALEHGLEARPDLMEIQRRLHKGQYQAGVVVVDEQIHAAFVLEIGNTEDGKVLAVSMIGGTGMAKWFDDLREFVIEIAHRIGAVAIRVAGRPAWRRILGREWRTKVIVQEARVRDL